MKGKTIFLFLTVAGLLIASCLPAGAAMNFSAGAHYDSFSSDQSREEGNQFFTPISLAMGSEGGLFGALNGGYVVSTYRPPEEGADDVTVSTLIDTKVALFYSAPVLRGCLRLGSTFNLPTGKSSLTPFERRAEMDNRYGELVSVTNFGEGTNANPGFAFALPLGRFVLGLASSYHFKGAYDPTAEGGDEEVDPGDEALAKVSFGFDGKIFEFLGGVKYLSVQPDKVGGQEAFKEGDMLSVNAKMEFSPGPWGIFLEGVYSTWYKGKRLAGNEGLGVEEFARFGDDLVVRAVVEYRVWPTLTLLAIGRGHWVQANDYEADSPLYDGDRTALGGTLGFRYALFPGMSLNGSVAYQQVDEGADAVMPEDTTYNGFRSALNLVTVF